MESRVKTIENIHPNEIVIFRCSLGSTILEIPQMTRVNVKYLTKGTYSISKDRDIKGTIIISIVMNSDLDDMLFIKLVNNVPDIYEFHEIMDMLEIGNQYFANIDITQKTIIKIQNWINRLGRCSYIWDNLTNKPDYNLEIQKKRFYPFYNIKNKEWKEISSEVRESTGYPPTNSKIFELGNDDGDDFVSEKSNSEKHNNYMSYPVLSPNKYGNTEQMIKWIKILISLELRHEAMESFLRLCITPSYCHIIKSTEVWKLLSNLINDSRD
jgi:hypothetical protein